jgi:LysM repeat protein
MHSPSQSHLASFAALIALLIVAAAVMPAAAADRVVIVRPGDTLSQIALEQGVSVADLIALNGLTNPRLIHPGQRLTVRASAPPAAPATAPISVPVIHRVSSGENLTIIATHYGTTIAAIVSVNGISNPSYLQVGQQLTIPGATAAAATAPTSVPTAAPATAPTSVPVIHRVSSGENLTIIATHYGTTIAAIVSVNGISNPSYLQVGQQLTIPGATAAPRGTSQPAPAPGSGGRGQMSAAMATAVAQRDGVGRLLVAEAAAQGVPVALVLAVAWQESGWQQEVVSSTGAIGVMQLMPATAEWIGWAMLGGRVDPHDAASNIQAGVRLLKHNLDRYGDRALALAAYYQGEYGTDVYGIYSTTLPYIAAIEALETIFSR